MSGSYVCASCRRRLFQRSKRRLEIQWHQHASFISFGGPRKSFVHDPPDNNSRRVEDRSRNAERRPPRPIPEQQPLRSVEDDFLERLLGGRERRYDSGPYSRPREPRPRRTATTKNTKPPPSSTAKSPSEPDGTKLDVKPEPLAPASTIGHSLPAGSLTPADIPLDYNHREMSISLPVSTRDGTAEPMVPVLQSQLLSKRSRRPPSPQALDDPASTSPTPLVQQVLADVRNTEATSKRSSYSQIGRSATAPPSSPVRKTYHHALSTPHPIILSGLMHRTYKIPSVSTRVNNGEAPAIFKPTYRPRFWPARDMKSSEQDLRSMASVSVPDSSALENVAKLEKAILDPKKSTAESWGAYLELQKHTENTGVRMSLKLRRPLFRKIVHGWCDGQDSGLQLTPSLILSRFAKTNYFDLISLRDALWPVLRRSVQRLTSGYAQRDKPTFKELSHELMKLWHLAMVYCARCKVTTDHGMKEMDKVVEWDTLIQSEQMKTVRSWFSKDFRARLIYFFPAFHPKSEESFDSAALITFLVFRSEHGSVEAQDLLSAEISSFRQFIAQLLPYSNFSSQMDRHQKIFATYSSSPESTAYVVEGLKMLAANAPLMSVVESQSTLSLKYETNIQNNRTASHDPLEDLFKRRIGRAIEDLNISRLEKLWNEAQTPFRKSKSENLANGLPVSLYGQFLTAFMALRRPNRAIEIWNAMMHAGVEPTVGAWDAMLKGCGLARDAEAVHDVWDKMIASGIKPDAQVWATRINGLISGGHWQSSVDAFREMTTTWADEVKKSIAKETNPDLVKMDDINGVPKPNTQTLNGLVAGLARGRKHEELVRILSWARTLGIKADAYTFNPLFRSAIKDGNSALALKLINQMQSLNIKPDVATFTMILQSLFRHDHDPSEAAPGFGSPTPAAESVETAAANVLQEMTRSGLQANAWTFATLINGLLKGPEGGNATAAYSVMSYMSANNITLSSQIYTSLLTYHFERQPAPDLAAVEALWNRARMDRGVFLDVFFFDRLIEGFARCGEIGKMMAALGQAGKRGKVPGWIAMTEVVKALAKAGDIARAEEIVARLKEEEQFQDDVRPSRGRLSFWQAVEDVGLQGLGQSTEEHTEVGNDGRSPEIGARPEAGEDSTVASSSQYG